MARVQLEPSPGIETPVEMAPLHEDIETLSPCKSSKKDYYKVDGRYAWIQVFAVGIIFFMLIGFTRSFSLLYEQLIKKFGRSDSVTAWVPSVHGTVKMCSSPLVGFLILRYDERIVCIFGAVTASVSLALTAVSPSIAYVFLFYGFLYGLGVNCCIITSQTNIAKYFDKKRGRALGFATFCSPMGGLAWSPLIQFLFEEYDYRGAMLIVSAITSHVCVSAFLMRPMPAKSKLSSNGAESKQTRDLIRQISIVSETEPDENIKMICKAELEIEKCEKQDLIQRSENVDGLSLAEDPASIECNEGEREKRKDLTDENKSDFCCENEGAKKRSISTSAIFERSISTSIGESDYIDVFIQKPNTGSLSKDDDQTKWMKSTLTFESLGTGSLTFISSKELGTSGRCQKILHSIARGFGLALLRDAKFTMYCAFVTVVLMGVNANSIFQTVLIREYGYSEKQAVTSLLIYNSVDMPIRLISGLVYDHKVLRNHKVGLSIALFLMVAVMHFVLPFTLQVHFIFGMFCLVITSIARGIVVSQNANVIMTLVGGDKCAIAISLSRFFQGFGVLISGPIVGALKDVTGSYATGYMVIASLVTIPALALLVIKLTNNCKKSVRR